MKLQTTLYACLALGAAGAATAETATNAVASGTEELGLVEGKPVTNGFVFVDGRYLAPPYTVVRQGNTVQINGVVVECPCPWPIPAKPVPQVVTQDPALPPTLTENSSKYDTNLLAFIAAKRSYYREHLGLAGRDLSDAMAKAYAALPSVKGAKLSADPGCIDVVWNDGGTSVVRVVIPSRKPIEWTRDSLLGHLDQSRANYEKRLEQGDYFFLGTSVSRMTGTAEGAAEVLPPLIEALRTSRDPQELYRNLRKGAYPTWGPRASEAFFSHRAELGDLEQRVEALRQRQKDLDRGETH